MVNKILLLLENIKKKLMPDLAVLNDVNAIVEKINKELKNSKIPAECVKGGSIAKETFLKNDYDADLFVRFDASFNEDYSNALEITLKNAFPKLNIERVHGSRDYFQFKEKIKNNNEEINYEIIPVMKIHSSNYKDAKNVTDLSPEHVFWVEKYTKNHPELKDEIRLAKQFCKVNKTYGAESYINGFSGHMIDILIIHYGSFIELINAASKWDVEKNKNTLNKKIIIDHEKHLKNPLKELNESKTLSPLIIVDPIQIDRNAAAAMSYETLEKFILSCKNFLNAPDKSFFEIKKFDIDAEIKEKTKIIEIKKSNLKIKNKKTIKLITLKIKTLDGSKDIVGTKILKIFELLNTHIKLNEFNIIFSDWHFDFEKRNSEMYFIIDNETLSSTIEQIGPPIKEKKDYDNFIQKHTQNKNKIITKNNRAYAITPRKYLIPEKLLADLIKENFIFSRAREIKIDEIKEITLK